MPVHPDIQYLPHGVWNSRILTLSVESKAGQKLLLRMILFQCVIVCRS